MIDSKIKLFQDKRARPRIRPRKTALDWTLAILTLDFLLAAAGYAAWKYATLPPTIGTRFDDRGQPIQTGVSWEVFVVPAAAILVCLVLWVLQRFPWISNTLVVITEQNAERQYQLINRLLSWIGLTIAVSFTLLTYQQIQQAQGNPGGMGAFWMVVILLEPVLIVWYLITSFREA